MLENKNIKDLLQQHAMHETGADFTVDVMNKIAAMQSAKQASFSLLKSGLIKVLIAVFIVVFIALIVMSVSVFPSLAPQVFKINLASDYVSKLISFLIAFWVVMLMNQLLKRKNTAFIDNAA